MAGLLDYVSSIAGEAKNYASSVADEAKKNASFVADEAKKNVQGLLADPKQQLMKTLNNLTARVAASQAKTKAAWATGDPKIIAQNALDSSQTALGFAPLGITAWHGSPHKFNKFSTDKIGTGEGAQAYGHGLYLAEAPAVAQAYSANRAYVGEIMNGKSHNVNFDDPQWIAQNAADEMGGVDGAISHLGKVLNQTRGLKAAGQEEINSQVNAAIDLLKGGQIATKGSLYKTDIPDEAVARFLDWDKPLSQQSKEVQAAIEKMKKHVPGGMFSESLQPFERGNSTGSSLHRAFESDIASTGNGQASKTFSMLANEYGIPGIRYLDGGSRSAGQGSSNFVVFDPEMIRILERNGQATGNIPWQPGEWRGLLGNN